MQKLTKGFGILGLILMVFGMIAWAITRINGWYVYTHGILGFILIAIYLVFNFEQFRVRLQERSTTEGGKVFTYAGIVLFIIIAVNIISFRKSTRWDFTENKVYSLEQQTTKMLENLKTPVEITAFLASKNEKKPMFREIVETYVHQNKLVSYAIVDPDQKPDLVSRLSVKDGSIRIVYGATDRLIASFDEAQIKDALKDRVQTLYYFGGATDADFQKLQTLLNSKEIPGHGVTVQVVKPEGDLPPGVDVRKPTAGNVYVRYAQKDTVIDIRDLSEQALTNAIRLVARQRTPVVRFATGHAERALDDEEASGLSVLRDAIKNEGYDVATASTPLSEGVQAGTDIFVIAGPQQPYSKLEADSVDRYLEQGGNVVMLIDPNISNPKLNPTVSILENGLEGLLDKWGMVADRNIVLEMHKELLRGLTTDAYVYTSNFMDHPIVAPLQGQSVYFDLSRTVRLNGKATPNVKQLEFIRTEGRGSWGESEVTLLLTKGKAESDAKDQPGPVTIGVVSERTSDDKSATKLVVLGDSDFVTNRHIRTYEANYDLFLNSLNWMSGQEEQISIRPKQLRSSTLLLTPEQTNIIFYTAVLTIPELILILGLVIYWRRRSR